MDIFLIWFQWWFLWCIHAIMYCWELGYCVVLLPQYPFCLTKWAVRVLNWNLPLMQAHALDKSHSQVNISSWYDGPNSPCVNSLFGFPGPSLVHLLGKTPAQLTKITLFGFNWPIQPYPRNSEALYPWSQIRECVPCPNSLTAICFDFPMWYLEVFCVPPSASA